MKEEEEREKEEKEEKREREGEVSWEGVRQQRQGSGAGQNNMEETTLGRPTRGKAGLARYWRANMGMKY